MNDLITSSRQKRKEVSEEERKARKKLEIR